MKKRNGSGIAQSEFEKAEEFNGEFSDVFTKSEYKQVPLLDRSAPFMYDIVVTKEEFRAGRVSGNCSVLLNVDPASRLAHPGRRPVESVK